MRGKGSVETSFSAVGTLFTQYVAGYTGSSVERRGKNPDDGAAWSIAALQDLLDEWLVTTWQARPHAGLFHPLMPGRELTPNEMYAALVETAGYVPVPLAASDYVELLPAAWRKVNAYGEQAWDYARKMLARRGQDPVTEAEIARAAAALLDKAEQGPPRGSEERRDRKAAARARAAAAAGPSVPEGA